MIKNFILLSWTAFPFLQGDARTARTNPIRNLRSE